VFNTVTLTEWLSISKALVFRGRMKGGLSVDVRLQPEQWTIEGHWTESMPHHKLNGPVMSKNSSHGDCRMICHGDTD